MRLGFQVGAVALLLALGAGAPALAQDEGYMARRLRAPAAPFVDVLSPYGTWLELQPFGAVWRPYPHLVGTDFIPYASHGRWAYAPVGWVFLSDWSWGWATFHYGYWLFDPSRGWLWVPGTVWAPAWVDWRYGHGFVGWAPLPPPYFHGWHHSRWPRRWCFAPVHAFPMTDVSRRLVERHQHPQLHEATQPVPPAPSRGGSPWPVGPAPEELVGPEDSRVPTVELRPPPAGQVERAEVGPVVERPPAALGAETWPREQREEAGAKPNVWMRSEPEEQSAAPEQATPPAQQPVPREERVTTPLEPVPPEERVTTPLEPVPPEERVTTPLEPGPREERGEHTPSLQPEELPASPRTGDEAPGAIGGGGPVAPPPTASAPADPPRPPPPPPQAATPASPEEHGPPPVTPSQQQTRTEEPAALPTPGSERAQPAPPPAEPPQPPPAPPPEPSKPATPPAPAVASPAPAASPPAPAPAQAQPEADPPKPSRPPPEAGAHASPARGKRER